MVNCCGLITAQKEPGKTTNKQKVLENIISDFFCNIFNHKQKKASGFDMQQTYLFLK